jgi:hypothetical protein
MSTAAYTVLRSLIIDGSPAAVGAVVNLSPDEAAPLVDSGDLAAVAVSASAAEVAPATGYRVVRPFILDGKPVFAGDPVSFDSEDPVLNLPGTLLSLGLVELV